MLLLAMSLNISIRTRCIAFLAAVCFSWSSSLGQSVSVPLRHDVYDFLKKMETAGLLREYHDIVRPISRLEAARLLKKVDSQANRLTAVDLRRLTFFQEEFGYEMGLIDPSWAEAPRRWHAVSEEISGGTITADLMAGLSEKRTDGRRVQKRSNGIRIQGYAFHDFGFSFTFVDNREQGSLLDRTKRLSPDDGLPGFTLGTGSSIEYDFTDVEFSYSTPDLTVSLEKLPLSWSAGERGSISLSTKAPSAPQVRLRARLTSWLTFTYVHAELNSAVIDSARSYNAGSSVLQNFFRPVYRQKYFAGHMLEMTPFDGVDIVLGESIVYSDRSPSLMYLIPVMFFKSGEHYNNDTDNTQFHLGADITLIPRVNIYGAMLIDELTLTDLFNDAKRRTQVGYTLGVRTFDLPLDDLEGLFEYTLINPWVYSHKFTAARFSNNGYDMGHWIGQNADLLTVELAYRPLREVRASVWAEVFRKGGETDVAFQYRVPSLPFLYGSVRTETSLGAAVVYEPVRDLFLEGRLRSVRVTDDANPLGAHAARPEFFVQIRYGVW